MIPFKERGMYQAAQNVLHGFGSICGASLGGSIADTIGWRWCFLLQVPVAFVALIVGYKVVNNQFTESDRQSGSGTFATVWERVDLSGALLLILGLSSQLVGLSLGGNELPWGNPWVILSLIVSVVILGLFFIVEAKTSAIPVIPLRMLQGKLAISTQISNVCVGMSAYAVCPLLFLSQFVLFSFLGTYANSRKFLFMLPLFFQVVLLDSASKAGARLIIPSLATPIGGLISGIVMSRWGKLAHLVRAGSFFMCIGNVLVMLLQFDDAKWKYVAYVFPASLGQGIVYPAILFTFLAAFDHAGKYIHTHSPRLPSHSLILTRN